MIKNDTATFRLNAWWIAAGATALAVWTMLWHWAWLRVMPGLHAVPAFFLGLFLIIVGTGSVLFCRRLWVKGWRWGFTWEAIRLVTWVLLLAVSTIMLFYSVELWRGKRAWHKVAQEAARLGAPLSLDALTPAPVPDDQNVAYASIFKPVLDGGGTNGTYSKVLGHRTTVLLPPAAPYDGWTTPLCPWLSRRNADLHAWGEFFARKKSSEPATRKAAAQELLQTLEGFKPDLDNLAEFSRRPYYRFPIEWRFGLFHAPTHLWAVQDIGLILSCRALAELELGNAQAALADIRLGLRILELSRQQAWPGLAIPGRNCALALLQPVWEGLSAHAWDAPQLEQLQSQLAGVDMLGSHAKTAEADLLALAAFFQGLVPTSATTRPLPVEIPKDDALTVGVICAIYPQGWSLQDQAAINEYRFHWAPFIDPATKRIVEHHTEGPVPALYASSDPFFLVFIFPRMYATPETVVENNTLSQTAVNLATVACALERFRLAEGAYPTDLALLKPGYITNLPYEMFNGQPFKYRLEKNSNFLLYSIGFNEKDDHGKPTPADEDFMSGTRKADWVWAAREEQP